jgi:hypothetical protein
MFVRIAVNERRMIRTRPWRVEIQIGESGEKTLRRGCTLLPEDSHEESGNSGDIVALEYADFTRHVYGTRWWRS